MRLRDLEAPITVTRSGDQLAVASEGRTLATVDANGVFISGELWFGLSSEAGSFRVSALSAAGVGEGTLRAVDTTGSVVAPRRDGLQVLAARTRPGFLVGAAVALGPLVADADYARALVSDFGAITLENAMKPQYLAPRQGVYSFAEADALITLAERYGLSVHGHTIAFGEALPQWMRDLPSGTAADRRSSAVALLEYVRTVVGHFAGRWDALDVVNELFEVDQGTALQDNVWLRVLGPEYPSLVSSAVHAVDPGVRQFINENGADVPGDRQDALLALALATNVAGGHIDGVGLQAHVYDLETDAIGVDELSRSIELFGRNGLSVRISENDVTDAEGTDVQADQYVAVFSACFRHPGCESWTTWGVDDRCDWYLDDGQLRQGHDYLYDDGAPTDAYRELRRMLEK